MDILFASIETGLSGINWNAVLLTALGIIQTAITSFLAIYLVKVNANAKAAIADNEVIKKNTAEVAVSVEKAHVAINSERTALTEELKKVRGEILLLSQQKATLEEHQRAQRAGEAVVVASPVAPARMTDTQIFQLLNSLSNEMELRKASKANK